MAKETLKYIVEVHTAHGWALVLTTFLLDAAIKCFKQQEEEGLLVRLTSNPEK